MIERLRARNEWKFFAVLPTADSLLAWTWWTLLVLRGALPALFAIAMGVLVAAVQRSSTVAQGATSASLGGALVFASIVFVLLQVLTPIHQAVSANLGDRTAAWLYDRLTDACVRPQGMGHLEDPALASDLTVARDFDLGMTGPPLSISMDFIAGGLVETIGGVASAAVLAAYTWWAPIALAGAWLSTHWLLRESGVWRDRNTDEVRGAQRDADYAYRLAVDPPASKELRLFGLTKWTIDRFVARRTRLHELQYQATRLRERPVLWSLLIVAAANVLVFWSLAAAVGSGAITLGQVVVFVQSAVGTSMIAFGGLNWALDGSAAPVAAVLRLELAMARAGTLASGSRTTAGAPRREIRFRDVTFAYPGGAAVLEHFDLTIPAGASLAIVGQNGAGKTTLVKLLAKLYEPSSGSIAVDDTPLARIAADEWRSRLAGAFQDFFRFEFVARHTVGLGDVPRVDDVPAVAGAIDRAGAADVVSGLPSGLDTQLGPTWPGGVDVSFGQWQKLALARGFMRDRPLLLVLDEPTAALDAETEHALFERYAAASRTGSAEGRVTILVSHRFSTVRMADLIVVLDGSRLIEVGTHEELMAKRGHYAELYGIQAAAYR